MVPLQKRGRATGKCGAGSELPASKVGRGPTRIDHRIKQGDRWRCEFVEAPAQVGLKREMISVLTGKLIAAGFHCALAAVIVAVRWNIAVVMILLTTAGQKVDAGQ